MLFNSYSFIFALLPVVVTGYYLLGRIGKPRFAISLLVMASLIFYAWWNPIYLLLLGYSIISNYCVGSYLRKKNLKFILTLGIINNLLLLGYFKYAIFVVDNYNLVFEQSIHLEKIILPLAISFFTFQQITYLVDCYRQKIRESNFLNYVLFVSFFPQLISGPIVHHHEMVPQFTRENIYQDFVKNILVGFSFFAIGLFKKTIIADTLGEYVGPIFDLASQGTVSTLQSWSALFAYGFQIYFDFSGYCDMAIGLAYMFGIRLPFNFDSPYKARNIFDFWNRWHVTFARFMRTHVYLPLAHSRRIKIGHISSIMISVILGGFWHGASWTFVLWGLSHAILLLVNHYWHKFRRFLGHDLAKQTNFGLTVGIFVTFFACIITRVLFRSDSMPTAETLLLAMIGSTNIGSDFSTQITLFDMSFLFGLSIIIWCFPNTQQIFANFEPCLDPNASRKRHSARTGFNLPKYVVRLIFKLNSYWGILIGLLFSIALIGIMRSSEFIYFQF